MNKRIAIRLLNHARKRIILGEARFICHEIMDFAGFITVFDSYQVVAKTANAMTTYIQRELEGFTAMELYLTHRKLPYARETAHLCRLAWIDKMVLSLETVGTLP